MHQRPVGDTDTFPQRFEQEVEEQTRLPIACIFKQQSRTQYLFTLPNGSISTRLTMTKWPPISAGPRLFPTASTPHRSLAAALCFDHGRRFQTTEGEGRYSLLAECGHRWPQSRQGDLKPHPNQGRFRLSRNPSHHDPGKSPSLLQRDIPGSHIARTQWSTNRTTSNSDYPVPISVGPLNGE